MDEEVVMWRADSYQKIEIKRCFPQEEKKIRKFFVFTGELSR